MDLAAADMGLGSDVVVWEVALLTAVSFAVGVLGGFVGPALGTMRLPALLLIGLPAPTAAGTNILISSLSSLAGAIRHLREGRVNRRIVMAMGVPAFAGAFAGGVPGPPTIGVVADIGRGAPGTAPSERPRRRSG